MPMRTHVITSSPRSVVLIIIAIFALSVSCSGVDCKDPKNASSATCVVENIVVDCTGVSSLPAAVAVVEPIVVNLVETARQADGSINWPAIEPQLVQIALQYGMCVVSEIWQHIINLTPTPTSIDAGVTPTPPSDGGVPQSPPTRFKRSIDPISARAAFERIRAKVAPHATFATTGGKL
jgi:hypothetical protein